SLNGIRAPVVLDEQDALVGVGYHAGLVEVPVVAVEQQRLLNPVLHVVPDVRVDVRADAVRAERPLGNDAIDESLAGDAGPAGGVIGPQVRQLLTVGPEHQRDGKLVADGGGVRVVADADRARRARVDAIRGLAVYQQI